MDGKQVSGEPLTARELEVLRLIALGLSNRDIAEQLVIGDGTAKTHTLNIYRKLAVRSRTQAVARARELGLLQEGVPNHISNAVVSSHTSDLWYSSFTARELEILRLIALGLSNRDIAEELVVAPETVRWYTKQIYSKLGVHGRFPALVRAKELGLLDEDASSKTQPATLPQQPANHNLPASTTPFIGRSREITEVKHLLQATRLLTLAGPGGSGKTRLALFVARDVLNDFANGVRFVDLAPLSTPTLVAQTIARVLGVVENPNRPLLDTLKHALAGQEMLLLLDNFEHVIQAAPLVSELLAAAPCLKALVTSREVLRISGEQEYLVPPLSLPPTNPISIQAVADSEAGALFVQRAQMMLPRFMVGEDNAPAIAQICTRLDGLPLAIELAAARCKLLSPQALLSRLDSRLTTLTGGSRDAPLRQQTLRHTIEWSYNLLDEDEKTLFARLAVFRGGRSLEAIEAVCGEGLPCDVFDALAALVDKNLVQQTESPDGEPRFVMLETIHEYAWERLGVSGEAETMRRRHAEYFTELAERAEPELHYAQQNRWFQLLEAEHSNLRAVLDWSLDSGEVAFGVRIAGALHLFWLAYGHHVEGIRWTQRLLDRLDKAAAIHYPKFLVGAGYLASLHDFKTAERLCRDALAISRELGDKLQAAWALSYMGLAMMEETEAALAAAEEGLALFRELDYRPGIAQTLNTIGEIARFGGDDARARRAYEECLAVSQEIGQLRRTMLARYNLTFIAQHEGDYQRAKDIAAGVLRSAWETNLRLVIVDGLALLAGSIGMAGQPERAARLWGAWEAALERIGAFPQPADKPEFDRISAAVRAQLDEATFEAAWAEGRKMTLEQAVAYALEESAGVASELYRSR
jgi:non-specific serine/threonine protein kinase